MKKFTEFLTNNSELLIAILGVITALLNILPQNKEDKDTKENKKTISQPCPNFDLNVIVLNQIKED
jgi:hypothetical protein